MALTQRPAKRDILIIVGLVIAVFVLSASRAWVHHRVADGEYWVLNYPPNLPFMWQYDTDANMQLSSAAMFPNYYQLQPMFTDRPGMQASAFLIGSVVGKVLGPLYETEHAKELLRHGAELVQVSDIPILLDTEELSLADAKQIIIKFFNAAAGIILFKILAYCIALIMMYQLVRRYTSQECGLYSVCFLLFSGTLFTALGIYHTYEFQILTPILILYLYSNLTASYSNSKNIFFSLIVGCLMLVKPNYAAYIAILFYTAVFLNAEIKTRFVGVVTSIVAHSVPWLAWHWYLEINGMGILGVFGGESLSGKAPPLHPYTIVINEFFMTDAERLASELDSGLPGGGGPSLLQTESFSDPKLSLIGSFQLIVENFGRSIRVYAFPLGFLAILGCYLGWRDLKLRAAIILTAVMLAASWLQGFIAFPFDFHSRTMRDPAFLIFSFGVFGLLHLTKGFGTRSHRFFMVSLVTLTLTVTVLNHVRLPWVHPMDQKGLYSIQSS